MDRESMRPGSVLDCVLEVTMELWLLLLIFLLLPVAGLVDVLCAQFTDECAPRHAESQGK